MIKEDIDITKLKKKELYEFINELQNQLIQCKSQLIEAENLHRMVLQDLTHHILGEPPDDVKKSIDSKLKQEGIEIV